MRMRMTRHHRPTRTVCGTSAFWMVAILLCHNCCFAEFQINVVGGSEAANDEYPYFVQYGGCGATLIHPDIALTAAHCSRKLKVAMVAQGVRGNMYMKVLDRQRHPDYDRQTLQNDVTVLKLGGWSSNDVIRLKNNRNKPLKDDPLTVIGYGQVTENGVTSTVLQEAKVLAYSGADCIKSYQGETTKVDIATMLCAAGPNGADSCKGDSGGPLIDSWGEQVGIVSWGEGCGNAAYPGVYARVSHAWDWIQSQICQLSEQPPTTCRDRDVVTNIRIDIQYDSYPEDTSWVIKKKTTNRVVASSTARGEGDENLLMSQYFHLGPGRYIWEVKDVYGDGMTLGYQGYYRVVQITSTGETIKLKGNGEFSLFTSNFVVD